MSRREPLAKAVLRVVEEHAASPDWINAAILRCRLRDLCNEYAAADAAMACGPSVEDVRVVVTTFLNMYISKSEEAAARRLRAWAEGEPVPKPTCGECGGSGHETSEIVEHDSAGYPVRVGREIVGPCPTCQGGEPR